MPIVTTTYRYKRPPRKRAKAAAIDAPAEIIVTASRPRAASLPPGLLAETEQEHQRRGDAAAALWRELVRRATSDQ